MYDPLSSGSIYVSSNIVDQGFLPQAGEVGEISCIKFSHPTTIYASMILLLSNQFEAINPLLKKCERKVDLKSRTLLTLSENPNARVGKDFERRLKQIKDKKSSLENDMIKIFKKSLKTFEMEKGIDKETKIRKIAESLKKSKSIFWKNFIELNLAVESGNSAWVRRVFKSFINVGPEVILFDEENSLIKANSEWKDDFLKMFKRLEKYFEEDVDKFDMFISQINFLFSGQYFNEVKNQFSVNFSLTDLREISKKTYSSQFYYPWIFNRLYPRTSDIEALNFLEKTFKNIDINELRYDQYWVLYYYFPKGDKIRGKIINDLIKMWNSQSFYYKYLVIRAMEDQVIKENLSKKSQVFRKPLFKIKREFYQSLLLSGKSTQLAIYNLILLGDLNLDNLFWMINR